jgi:lipopolysaccharide biosynthesis regulator YciM
MNSEIKEVLETCFDYMNKLNAGILTAAQYFQNGNYYEALDLTVQITEGLQWVIQVINLNKELYNEESQIEELNEKLNEALEAFQNQDYILIGDLFEYEISPIIENYIEMTKIILNN